MALQSESEVFKRYPTLNILLSKQIYQSLSKHGNPGLAVLYKFGFNAVKINPNEQILQDLRNLADKETLNNFEKSIIKISPSTFNQEIQARYATWLMKLNEWEAAEKAWAKILGNYI